MKLCVKYCLFIIPFFSQRLDGQSINLFGKLKLSDSMYYSKIVGYTEATIQWHNIADSTLESSSAEIDLNFVFRNVQHSNPKIIIRNYFHSTDTCQRIYYLQNFGFEEILISDWHLLEGNNNFVLTYPPACKYQSEKCNNTCPTCKKSDNTIPILYGLPIENTDGTIGPKYEYYSGGCYINHCGPYWHCKRDNIEF